MDLGFRLHRLGFRVPGFGHLGFRDLLKRPWIQRIDPHRIWGVWLWPVATATVKGFGELAAPLGLRYGTLLLRTMEHNT